MKLPAKLADNQHAEFLAPRECTSALSPCFHHFGSVFSGVGMVKLGLAWQVRVHAALPRAGRFWVQSLVRTNVVCLCLAGFLFLFSR